MSLYSGFLFFIMTFLVACVANEAKQAPARHSDDKGPAVYIYRPASFSNIIVSPGVIIDGKERFQISNDKYTFVYMPPGKHVIKLNLDDDYHGNFEHQIDIKSGKIAGQVYFLRVDTSMKFVQGEPYIRSFDLSEVTREVGLDEVKECGYMKPEMPSKYLLRKGQSGNESRFTTDKTSDPFSRNK